MKRILAIAFTACMFAACDNNTTETTSTEDSLAMGSNMDMENSAIYSPTEGDVTYREGRVQVYRSGNWEEANEDVRMDNGVVVYRSGRIERDGTEYEWEDGYAVDTRGNVWDRTGNALVDAWDATKHGVRKAGQAVGDAAERVGEETKDAFDGKDDKDKRNK